MSKEQLQALWNKMTADKKKFGIMCGLLVVGLLMWGRLLLKEVPRTATAVPQNTVAEVTPAPIQAKSAQRTNTHDAVVNVAFPRELQRDLFRFDPSPYKRTASSSERADLAKLPGDMSDESYRIGQVRQAAKGLSLQSVMNNQTPHAMINGQIYQVGETVEGFKVTAIGDRSVHLSKDGFVIRLGM